MYPGDKQDTGLAARGSSPDSPVKKEKSKIKPEKDDGVIHPAQQEGATTESRLQERPSGTVALAQDTRGGARQITSSRTVSITVHSGSPNAPVRCSFSCCYRRSGAGASELCSSSRPFPSYRSLKPPLTSFFRPVPFFLFPHRPGTRFSLHWV